MRIDRGWTSPGFINNQGKDECTYENVKILVCDTEISNIVNIQDLLVPFFKGERILIIAPCTSQVINVLVVNVLKSTLKAVNVIPPNHGYRSHELMEDIAIAVGAKCFSEKTGDDLSHIKYEDLGHAEKVVVGHNNTTIILDKNSPKQEDINTRVSQLRDAYNNEQKKADKDFLLERIASLTGGIGVIYVGGNTDTEQKELFDRVDDSICAVRSALEEGIVAGGGKALWDILLDKPSKTPEQLVANLIMENALKAPLSQILKNAGLDSDKLFPETDIRPIGSGYNVKTGKYGDMIKMGVIDPVKVVRCALENAISVAVTILSTNCVITIARQQ
jgi:chaperonin GroEL